MLLLEEECVTHLPALCFDTFKVNEIDEERIRHMANEIERGGGGGEAGGGGGGRGVSRRQKIREKQIEECRK